MAFHIDPKSNKQRFAAAGIVGFFIFVASQLGGGGGGGTEFTVDRSTGVAPFCVSFTATGIGFDDQTFTWDFDDPGAGTWGPNGLSRNSYVGPIAKHCYETPGSYSPELTSPTGTYVLPSPIVVTNPTTVYSGTNTRCFSTSGTFTSCPAGATQVTTSNLSTICTHFATGRRLLLRRGETFTRDSTCTIDAPGPMHLGEYGSGAKPIISCANCSAVHMFVLSDSSPTLTDLRFVDVDLQYTGTGGTCDEQVGGSDCRIINVAREAQNLVFLRVDTTGARNALNINLAAFESSGDPLPDGVYIHDSTFSESASYLHFVSATNLSIQGCTFIRVTAHDSLIRYHMWVDTVFSNNQVGPQGGAAAHALYVYGPGFSSPFPAGGNFTERFHIADNIVDPGNALDWAVHISVQNGGSDERFRDGLVERNFVKTGTAMQYCFHFQGNQTGITVRDNVCYAARAGGGGFSVQQNGGTPNGTPEITYVQNTLVSPNATAKLVRYDTDDGSCTALNNAVCGASAVLVSGTGTCTSAADNSVQTQAQCALTSSSPTTIAGFEPTGTSTLLGAGNASTAGTLDIVFTTRGNPPDDGAYERTP